MDEIRSAMNEHVEQMADLIQNLSSELRTGFKPAIDNFIGFFHAIDWKWPVYISPRSSIVSWPRIGRAFPLRITLTHTEFSSLYYVLSNHLHHSSCFTAKYPLFLVSPYRSMEKSRAQAPCKVFSEEE
ncbi:hypothetical protein ACFE04_006542 [Oxalis oulophora]